MVTLKENLALMGRVLGNVSHIFAVWVSSWFPLYLWGWRGVYQATAWTHMTKRGSENNFCFFLPITSAGASPFPVCTWLGCREERGLNVD